MLETDRLLRPTAEQVLERLHDLDLIHPVEEMQCWVARCCTTTKELSTHPITFNGSVPQWPILDLMSLYNHLAYLFLDENLQVIAHSDKLSFLDKLEGSGTHKIERLLASGRDMTVISNFVRSMWASRPPRSCNDANLSSCLAQSLSSIFHSQRSI